MLGRLALAGCTLTKDLWISMEQVRDIRNLILSAWTCKGLDAVLAPGFAFLAPPHNYPSRLGVVAPVAGAYNVLNFPVGAMPMVNKTRFDQVRWLMTQAVL